MTSPASIYLYTFSVCVGVCHFDFAFDSFLRENQTQKHRDIYHFTSDFTFTFANPLLIKFSNFSVHIFNKILHKT